MFMTQVTHLSHFCSFVRHKLPFSSLLFTRTNTSVVPTFSNPKTLISLPIFCVMKGIAVHAQSIYASSTCAAPFPCWRHVYWLLVLMFIPLHIHNSRCSISPQGILDASRQRHNSLWRSKSETNLQCGRQPSGGRHRRQPPLLAPVLPSADVTDTASDDSATCNPEPPAESPGGRPNSWSPADNVADALLAQMNGEKGIREGVYVVIGGLRGKQVLEGVIISVFISVSARDI